MGLACNWTFKPMFEFWKSVNDSVKCVKCKIVVSLGACCYFDNAANIWHIHAGISCDMGSLLVNLMGDLTGYWRCDKLVL